LIPNGIRLDNQVVAFQADLVKSRWTIELPHAGTHQLEVLFHPTETKHSFEFSVPSVARSYVEFPKDHGDDDSPWELKSAIGSVSSAEAIQSSAWLGPAGHIVLQPHINSTNAAIETPLFEVEQLDWLHVQPGSVTQNVQLHLNVQSGKLQQLKLLIDPRWQ